MANNKETATFVVDHIGGEENVNSLVHCATRLRFKLKDVDQVDEAALKNHPGVLTAVESGGQYQVVIGNNVAKVYQEIMNTYNISSDDDTDEASGDDIKSAARSKNPLSVVFEYISGTISPLIPVLAGSGMIKALLALFELLGILGEGSSTYAVLNAASNGLFYFFPIFIGISAARYFKVSPFIGGVIAAALLDPSFTSLAEAGEMVSFLGLPLVISEYANTVFPMLVAIAVYAPLERFLRKHSPDMIELFFVPMMGILIMVPLTALVFGPFSQYISGMIGAGLVALLNFSSTLTGVIFASIWPFLVVLGIHWGVTPISLDNLARNGADPLNAMAAAGTFAQMGIAFGIFLRYRKDEQLSPLSLAGVVSGVTAGVTEPILYGLILRYKRLIPILVASSAVGGGILGFFNTYMHSFAFNSVLTIPAYGPIPQYVLGISVSFITATILTYIFGLGDRPEAESLAADNQVSVQTTSEKMTETPDQTELVQGEQIKIQAPLVGELLPLSEVDDEAFASEAMGKGGAILPTEGDLKAPFDGKITLLFPSKHAIGLTDKNGVELLIHIGMDTVELDGKHFTAHVEQDQEVKAGDTLISFDIEAIKAAGYSVVTPIVVTNHDNFKQVASEPSQYLEFGNDMLTVVK